MTLIRWRPIRDLESVRRDMERFFGDTFEPFDRGGLMRRFTERGLIVPNIDLFEKKSSIVMKAELPGIDKENVDLTITRDSITIKGEIKKEEEVKDEDYYCSECSTGSFARTITLPKEVDASKAKANFKNGVLVVTLPKVGEEVSKEVKLKIE